MLEDEDDEQDSLFGSPPPPPVRGRSPAFPSQAAQETGTGITQNVGTIALPGSHMSCSELPAKLAAPPLGCVNTPRARALPLQSAQNTLQRQSTHLPHVAPSASSSQRVASVSRTFASRTTGKRNAIKSKSSTPRPAPPPITLPGPEEPLPSNFLRSQKALLGIAGLVGNIKPTSLPQQAPRGSTPYNPIIVEELDPTRFAQSSRLSPVHPSQLPLVSGDNVITSLIKQKNIFPVLSSILKLLGNSPEPLAYPQSTHKDIHPPFRPCNAPAITAPSPFKRRKLTSVPAGAVDWDVPYPFPEGEGPEAYHATWERERAKQLIIQLLELIKNAVQGAAAKKHTRKIKLKKRKIEDEGTDVRGSVSKESSAIADGSRSSTVEFTSDRSSSVGVDTSTDSFDHLLASLLSGVPSPVQNPFEAQNMPLGDTIPEFDEALFESWLAELQTLPPPEGSDEPVHSQHDLSRSNTPVASVPSMQFTQKPTALVSQRVGHKSIRKEDILQRARGRRRQIVAEIERAKVELWETSIEGGVLGHMMKDPTLS